LSSDKTTQEWVRSTIGSLLWLARTSRIDILYAVNVACAHTHAPFVLRRSTQQHGQIILKACADADFAGEPEENDGAMKSTTGIIAYIHGVGPFFGQAKLQDTISRSTAEAEYKAVGAAGQFCMSIRQLLEEIGLKQIEPTMIYNDNNACISTATTKVSSSKLRHVKINFH